MFTMYAKASSDAKVKIKETPESQVRELGVISEISFESLPQERQDKIKSQIQGKGNLVPANYRMIYGDSVRADGTVSFYGASMTREQSEKLQSVIKDLEEQGHGSLGDSWNTEAYVQLGLKVSQLSYICKEVGLSDEAAAQVIKTYREVIHWKLRIGSTVLFVAIKRGKN